MHMGNTRPSRTFVIQDYRYYTMSLSQYKWQDNRNTSDFWTIAELLLNFELWVIFELWVTFELWVRVGGQTNTYKQTEMAFQNGINPISHLKKSHFTLEQIEFHIEKNPISHWNNYIGINPISHWNISNFRFKQIQLHIKKM